MYVAVLNSSTGCSQCLPQYLTTKYLRASYVLAFTPEYILFDAFKVKQLNQPFNCSIQGIWIAHDQLK